MHLKAKSPSLAWLPRKKGRLWFASCIFLKVKPLLRLEIHAFCISPVGPAAKSQRWFHFVLFRNFWTRSKKCTAAYLCHSLDTSGLVTSIHTPLVFKENVIFRPLIIQKSIFQLLLFFKRALFRLFFSLGVPQDVFNRCKCSRIWSVFHAAITSDFSHSSLLSQERSKHSWKLKPLLMTFLLRSYKIDGSNQHAKWITSRIYTLLMIVDWSRLAPTSCVWNLPFQKYSDDVVCFQ